MLRPCGLIVVLVLCGAARVRSDDSYVAALKHSQLDVMPEATKTTGRPINAIVVQRNR